MGASHHDGADIFAKRSDPNALKVCNLYISYSYLAPYWVVLLAIMSFLARSTY